MDQEIQRELQEINDKMDEVLLRTEGLRFTGSPADLHQDMQFLRGVRMRSEEAGATIRRVAYTTFIGGLFTALWFGITHYPKN